MCLGELQSCSSPLKSCWPAEPSLIVWKKKQTWKHDFLVAPSCCYFFFFFFINRVQQLQINTVLEAVKSPPKRTCYKNVSVFDFCLFGFQCLCQMGVLSCHCKENLRVCDASVSVSVGIRLFPTLWERFLAESATTSGRKLPERNVLLNVAENVRRVGFVQQSELGSAWALHLSSGTLLFRLLQHDVATSYIPEGPPSVHLIK